MKLPVLDDIAAAGDNVMLLCATQRLARNLRLGYHRI
jgi:hypothetical protein